jgi:hypothetical protein
MDAALLAITRDEEFTGRSGSQTGGCEVSDRTWRALERRGMVRSADEGDTFRLTGAAWDYLREHWNVRLAGRRPV